MELSDTLLQALRCPKTKQRLHRATPATLEPFLSIEPNLKDALITEDGCRAYPIDDGFPILLADRAVELPSN